jgi:hypothetical protein
VKLAVIGTFYGRHQNSLPLLKRLYVDSTYTPDEAWLVCETPPDALSLYHAYNVLYETEMLDRWPTASLSLVVPTRKPVIPYSNKINWALDRTHCDTIVYLDNGSMPDPEKYETMYGDQPSGRWRRLLRPETHRLPQRNICGRQDHRRRERCPELHAGHAPQNR